MDISLTRLVENLLYPPAGPLLLLLAGTLLLRRFRRSGYSLIAAGWLSLYLAALPAVNALLFSWLEQHPPLTAEQVRSSDAGAIVVLGGERYFDAPEYGGSVSGLGELERVRYAAHLYRLQPRPIAVIGGDALKTGQTEAQMMRMALEGEFNIPVAYSDGRSLNTFDNARFAAETLLPQGINHVLLVSQAWHLPRAVAAFEQAGLQVSAAPTGFYTQGPMERGWKGLLPSAKALVDTRKVLHEALGLIWYRLLIQQSDSG